MKQYIRYIPVVVLLLCSTVAFARGNNVKIADDIANNVTYSIESGAEGIVVTLTVTPSDGFYLESIRAEKTVDASAAARRRADIPVGGEYALTKTSASADRSQVATYTLNLEGEFGAYVTASFKSRTEITAEQVALSAGSFTYSGSDQKPAVSVEGLTLDTDYAVTYAETAWTNVGTYTVTVTGIDTYMGAQSKTWAIGPKEATVTTGSASREYDGTALTNAETDITGLVGGETVTVTATGSQTDVGISNNTYTIDWGNTLSGNYSITDDLGTLEVTPKAVTVTADNQTKVYGTDDPELTAAVDGTIGEDEVTYSLSRAEGENVGEYAITPSGDTEQGNYVVTYTNGTLTITAATLTDITATPYSGTYDGAAHSIEVTIPEGAAIKYGTAEGTYDMDEAPSYTNVGTYTIFYQVTKDNYNAATGRQTVTINSKAVTVTADNQTKVYGTADPELTAIVDGTIGEDEITYVLSRAEGENVGEYTITPSGETEQGNYTVSYTNGTLTITAATLTDITATAYEGTYDGAAHTIEVTIPEGAAIKYGTAEGTYDMDEAPEYTNVGTYTIFYQVTKDNYNAVTGSQTVTISAKAVTVTADDQTKVYGTADPELTAVVDGTIGEDVVTFVLNRAEGEDVGEYAITPSGETEQGNYTVSYTAATLTITPATMTDITATAYEGIYDGAAHSIEVTIPEGAAIKYGTAEGTYDMDEAPDYTNVGTYTIYYQVTKDNYNAATGSQTVTINSKAVTITADNQTKVFGTADPELTAIIDGTIGEDKVTYVLSRAEGEDVGEYAITPSGETEQGNYLVTYTNGTLTITAATLTDITATAYEGIYDGAAHTIEVMIPEGAAIKYGTAEDAYDMDEAPDYINVGTYTIYYQVTKDNFNAATGSQTVTINSKSVTVTADNQTKVYGTADPELTAAVDGTIGEDKVTYVLNRAEGENVGEYTITPSGDVEQGNYTVSYTTATLTITAATLTDIVATPYSGTYDGAAHSIEVTIPEGAAIKYGTAEGTYDMDEAPSYTNVGTYTIFYQVTKDNYNAATGSQTVTINSKAVTVTADNQTKVYGTADPELTAAVDGTIGEDKVTYSLSRAEGENVGEYAITPSGDVEQGNYTVSYTTATLTITAATLTDIVATPYSGTYDGAAHSIEVTIPDGAAIKYGTAEGTYDMDEAPNYTNVGTYTIFYQVTKDNYNAVTGSASVTINSKAVIVTADNQTKVYGTADPELTAAVDGTIGEDKVTYSLSRAEGEDVGEYTITPTGDAEQGNYTVSYTVATLTITAATINYSGGTIQMDENGYDVSLAENTGSANPLPISGTVDDLDYGRVLAAPGNGEGEMTIDNEPVNLYTVCLPFDPRTGTGVKYYTLSSVDGTTLKFTEVETAPAAFTPYLVAVSGSSNIIESCTNVTFETSHAINSTTVDGFTFSGTLTGLSNADARTAAGGSGKATYILQDNAKWGKVVNGNVYLPPFRGYVTGPDLNTGNARALASSFGGDATGIRNIRTIDADGTEHWYDLNGHRIDKPTQKGIYILNGRKEVIR